MEGHVIGNYRVISKLGEGGMGAVYLAEHVLIGQTVAIKILRKRFSNSDTIVARFFNEARASAAIKHPGIVTVIDFGYLPEGVAYLVMEHLRGQPLDVRLRDGARVPMNQALEYTRQIADALRAAHQAGIVHRDLKPDNIFLVPDAAATGGIRIKLLDFGIAKLMYEGVNRTNTGVIMGTPAYMAPEQCRGVSTIDHRADIYALGCILFQMLCGQQPFTGDAVGDILGGHMYFAPPKPSRFAPDIPDTVEQFVLQLLAKRPGERPDSAAAVLDTLTEIAGGFGNAEGGDPVDGPRAPGTQDIAPTRDGDQQVAQRDGQGTTLGRSAGERPAREQTLLIARRRLPVALVTACMTVGLAATGYVAWQRAVDMGKTPPPAARLQQPDARMESAEQADGTEPVASSPQGTGPQPDARSVARGLGPVTPDASSSRPRRRRKTAGRPRRKSKKTSKPKPMGDDRSGAKSGTVAPSLSQQQIDRSMSKVLTKVSSCGNLHQITGEVVLELEIAPGGFIKGTSVISAPSARLADCVVRLVKPRARFPITLLGITTRYSFQFQ